MAAGARNEDPMKQGQKLTGPSSVGPAMSHVVTSVMFYWCSHRAWNQHEVAESYPVTKHESKNVGWAEVCF